MTAFPDIANWCKQTRQSVFIFCLSYLFGFHFNSIKCQRFCFLQKNQIKSWGQLWRSLIGGSTLLDHYQFKWSGDSPTTSTSKSTKKHFQFLSSFLFHFFFHQMHKTTSVQAKKQLNWVLPLSLSLSSKLYYLWQTYRKWFLHYNSTLLTHSGEVWHSVRYIGDVMASWPNLSAAFGTPTHFYASVLRLDCKLKCI